MPNTLESQKSSNSARTRGCAGPPLSQPRYSNSDLGIWLGSVGSGDALSRAEKLFVSAIIFHLPASGNGGYAGD
jgi:hypothetical protein